MSVPLERLWSSDFDGTLYAGKRTEAVISEKILRTIATWILHGGVFHLLSSGSMAGMARDGFDFVPRLLGVMKELDVPNARAILRQRMIFSMANGAENYRVVRPENAIMEGQLSFQEASSVWVPQQKADDFCDIMGHGFHMKRLACDSPVSGKRGRVCSVFLQQAAHHGENGWQTQETANAHLDKVDIGLRVRFEHGDPLTGKARFDAFPLVNDTMVNKGMVAKRVFPSFASVVYTGDQPLGNDQPVFEYVKTQTRMSAHAVSGPEAVVNLIGTMCPARWIRVETATRTKKHPGAALPTT